MAQVVEDRDKSNFPRDLLNRFMAVNHHNHHHHFPMHLVKQEHNLHHDNDDEAEEDEEIELSLGLSMNGRFGVDPTAKKIKRTTSIPEFVKPVRGEEEEEGGDVGYPMPVMPRAPLIRTCSLPTETEEEWRKRKELQSLRRLEARRKRSEKQRNLKAIREQQQRNRDEVGGGGYNLMEQGTGEFGGLGRTTSLSSRVGGLGLNDKCLGGGGGWPPPSPSRGSIGSSSQGTGSSGISESESQQGQGSKAMDARSPIGNNSSPNCESPATSGARIVENSSKLAAAAMAVRHETTNRNSPPENKTKDIVRSLLEDMPSVSTKGDGPDGRRIEGFLYRYGKGEEVRIVCVCHGSFLTPAEFVKHAGGGDVANPLKHIVVSTSC